MTLRKMIVSKIILGRMMLSRMAFNITLTRMKIHDRVKATKVFEQNYFSFYFLALFSLI